MVTLIEDEKIIAGEKIIDLLQVINFLYSWSVKDTKKIYIELCSFFNFTVIFQPFCISLYLFELYMTYDVTVNRVASLYRSKLADKTNVNLQHEFLFN